MSGDAVKRPRSIDLQLAARVVERAGVRSVPNRIGSAHEGAKGSVFILGCEDGSALALKIYDSFYTERMIKERSLYSLLESLAASGESDAAMKAAVAEFPGVKESK